MRIALLSNVNLDLVVQALAKKYTVYQSNGYAQWIQEALSPERLIEFEPDAVFLILHGQEFNHDTIVEFKEALIQTKQIILKLAESLPLIPIFCPTVDFFSRKFLPSDHLGNEHTYKYMWYKMISEINSDNIHIFDLESIIAEYGRKYFYSEKMWYLGSIPYSIKGITVLAEQINDRFEKIASVRKKVLVLDLDNTLWGGVLSEDGIEGISLSDNLSGAIYQNTQKIIKDISKTGVILAIVSKNDKKDVINVLREHPHMILREADFVAIYSNWNDKWRNILELGDILNLNLNSFVFLDDNSIERESVKRNLPEVTVVDFPKDAAQLPLFVLSMAKEYFFVQRLTDEDKLKTQQYQQETLRKGALEKALDIDDYIISMQIKVTIQQMKLQQSERVVQLLHKTNQFNVLTNRFQIKELAEYAKENFIFVGNVSDKFGDSGLVILIMIRCIGDTAYIDNFLMSCRVMGRSIEDSFIDAIEKHLLKQGIKIIHANYVVTEKNKPVEFLFERLDYELMEINEIGAKHYRRNILDKTNLRKKLFTAEWGK